MCLLMISWQPTQENPRRNMADHLCIEQPQNHGAEQAEVDGSIGLFSRLIADETGKQFFSGGSSIGFPASFGTEPVYQSAATDAAPAAERRQYTVQLLLDADC